MATNSPKERYGKYICKEGVFDIRLKHTQATKNSNAAIDYRLYRSKNLVKGGFKSKEAAIEYCNNNT